jgi:hypothetical protein
MKRAKVVRVGIVYSFSIETALVSCSPALFKSNNDGADPNSVTEFENYVLNYEAVMDKNMATAKPKCQRAIRREYITHSQVRPSSCFLSCSISGVRGEVGNAGSHTGTES